MNTLTYEDLFFFSLLLKTYPDHLTIFFFLKDEESLTFLAKLIEEISDIKPRKERGKIVFSEKVNITLFNYKEHNLLRQRCNVIIVDSNFSIDTLRRDLEPRCFLRPLSLRFLYENTEYTKLKFLKKHKFYRDISNQTEIQGGLNE